MEPLSELLAAHGVEPVAWYGVRLFTDDFGRFEGVVDPSDPVLAAEKGLLMSKENLSEDEAFARLRKASQVSGRPLRVVAEAVLATFSSRS